MSGLSQPAIFLASLKPFKRKVEENRSKASIPWLHFSFANPTESCWGVGRLLLQEPCPTLTATLQQPSLARAQFLPNL